MKCYEPKKYTYQVVPLRYVCWLINPMLTVVLPTMKPRTLQVVFIGF